MARHIPRSHLRKDDRPACGSSSSNFLTSAAFLVSENRCQKCDRIARKLPSTSGRKKIEGRYPIVLSGLSMDTLNWLERLAAEGKTGETIGELVNEYALRRNDR